MQVPWGVERGEVKPMKVSYAKVWVERQRHITSKKREDAKVV